MRNRILQILIFFLFLTGCSNNELTLVNSTTQSVTTHFRGTRYVLPPASSQIISEIPDGEFAYEGVSTIPSGVDSVESTGMTGSIVFTNVNTSATLEYLSRIDFVTTDSTAITIYRISTASSTSNSVLE